MRVDFGGPSIDLFDIGMIDGVREHAGNNPALLSHFQPLLDAEFLDARWHAA